MSMHPYLAILRPQHWIKNLLVFAGMFLSLRFTTDIISSATTMFLGFCLAASAIYIINDIKDREKDKNHPSKRHRPLASGKLSLNAAYVLLAGLLITLGLLSVKITLAGIVIIVSYIAMNIGYTFWLKEIVLLDILTISAGFVMRALAGTLAIGIPISSWFLITVATISLYLAFQKRLHEKLLPVKSQRTVVRRYSKEYLEHAAQTCAILSIAFYSLYILEVRGSIISLLSVFIVMFGFFRYMYTTHHHNTGSDPVEDFLNDKILISLTIAWVVIFFLGVTV